MPTHRTIFITMPGEPLPPLPIITENLPVEFHNLIEFSKVAVDTSNPTGFPTLGTESPSSGDTLTIILSTPTRDFVLSNLPATLDPPEAGTAVPEKPTEPGP